ncbi:MAG: hypothetical protein ACR2P7_06265 [bacterium]
MLLPTALLPTAYADHVGGPPYAAGILCLDGANRGGVTRMVVRGHTDKDAKGRIIYTYPWLGYYARKVCKRLSDIGVKVGEVVEIWHEPESAFRELRRCTDRYTVKNNGVIDNQHKRYDHIFVQVGGRSLWDSNCNFKTNWGLPHHALHLRSDVPKPESAAKKLGDKRYNVGVYKAPVKAGIVCFDGANRGSNDLIAQIRYLRSTKLGKLVYESSRMGYYTRTECVNLSKIGVKKGTKMAAWTKLGENLISYSATDIKSCKGRDIIEHDDSDQVVWIQMRGGSIWDYYCETKRALDQPPLK